jgi:DNA-binding SARP family transcriptional activator
MSAQIGDIVIATLHLHLLGDFRLTLGDTPVLSISSQRLQSLLAYMALHRSAPQDRSHVAFLLWPESTEARAHASLRKLLYQLRQALPEIDHFLQADRHSIYWLPADNETSWTLDIKEIEEALVRAEQTQDASAKRQALQRIRHLYRGDLLPSCYDEWILPERDHWHQVFLQTAERLITLLEDERDYDAAIPVAQQLLRHDPLHEATSRQLMRLYALQGDRASAIRVYHTCVTVLERELGTEPGEATRAIYQTLMESDGSSKAPVRPPTTRGTRAPLLGRKEEWKQLQTAWSKATAGHAHIVTLTGEAGIGKTRLAEELEAWVSRLGMTTARAGCYADFKHVAYAPVTSWLRTNALHSSLLALDAIFLTEIARLLPELLATRPALASPSAMTEGWQRQHFFEALTRAVQNASHPLLLLLDDLQWCDQETLDWLQYLLRFEPGARMLVIGTVRVEEIDPEHPLIAFLTTLQREGLVTEVPLGPLTITEVTSLAEQLLHQQLDASTRATLYHETEGNPLFVVEMARAGTLKPDGSASSITNNALPLLSQPASSLPPVVQSVLQTRIAQLSPLAREVANVAAIIGREFAFSILAQASREQEDAVVSGLDELWQRRIIREQGAGAVESYDFSHDKLREQVYASLSPASRRLLHRRVAEAIEEHYARNLDAVSGQLATHYERAGLPERAISYYRHAGEIALRMYANAEAMTAFQRAAALLHTSGEKHLQHEQLWEGAAAIYTALGDIFAMTGRQHEAREAYQDGMTSLQLAETSITSPGVVSAQRSQWDKRLLWQARLLRKTASTWNLTSNNPMNMFHDKALPVIQQAEEILGQVEDKKSAEWIHEWIDLQIDQLLPLRGAMDDMTMIIDKAQAVVEQYGTARQRGRFFQAVAARDAIRDRYTATEESVGYCRDSLAALQQTDDKDLIGFAHFVLGNRLLWLGKLDEAEEELRDAIHIAEQIGYTTLLVRSLMFLPFVFRRRQQVEEVRSLITRAAAMPEARNIAVIKGHHAWVAWRDGDMAETVSSGLASAETQQRQQNSNAFKWAGLWPVIGVMLTQNKIDEAIDYARMLLDPSQQRLSETLSVYLEAASRARDDGKQEEACRLLQQAIPLAKEMGYL